VNRNVKAIAALLSAASAFTWTAPAAAINLETLQQQGELYVVALYTGYESEASYLERTGREDAAQFLRMKADGIEQGAELFPLHPMAFPAIDEAKEPALLDAYEVTFALVGSEAADVAPERIAAIQVAYETWLFVASEASNDALAMDAKALGQREWQLALNRFINWSEGSDALSAVSPERPRQISQREM